MFQFKAGTDIETMLLNSLGTDMIVPNTNVPNDPDVVEYRSNGDIMTVNIKTGQIMWEPINQGSYTSSKLALRLHQWFAKGIIKEIK